MRLSEKAVESSACCEGCLQETAQLLKGGRHPYKMIAGCATRGGRFLLNAVWFGVEITVEGTTCRYSYFVNKLLQQFDYSSHTCSTVSAFCQTIVQLLSRLDQM
jgi:hypothetical protein